MAEVNLAVRRNQEVSIRRRDIHTTRLEACAILGMSGR
jgi:hypothetical protein